MYGLHMHNRIHFPTRSDIRNGFGRIFHDERLSALLIVGILLLLIAFAMWIGTIRI